MCGFFYWCYQYFLSKFFGKEFFVKNLHYLMSLAILFQFLCAKHVSDINISIIMSLRLFCWITTLVVLLLVRCVLEFRCGWVGVVSVFQASAFNTDTTSSDFNNILVFWRGFIKIPQSQILQNSFSWNVADTSGQTGRRQKDETDRSF